MPAFKRPLPPADIGESIAPQGSTYALQGGILARSLRLLGRGIKAEPVTFTIAIAASVLFGLGLVASGWALGQITDRVVVPAIEGQESGKAGLLAAGGILVLIGLVTAIGVSLRRIYAGMGQFDVQVKHRLAVTRQYVRLPIAWHRRHPTGQLLSNANADAEAAGFVFAPLPFALGVVAMLIVASVAMIATDVVMGVVGVAILPAILAANTIYRRYMAPAITQVQYERARTSDVAHESFEAADVVKALGTADLEEEAFDIAAQDLRWANVRVGKIRSAFDPIIEALPSLTTLAVLAIGASRAASGAAATGDVVTVAYLLTIMAVPVRAIGFVLGDLPRSVVGHDRVSRVIDARGYLLDGESSLRGSGGLDVAVDSVSMTVTDADGTTRDLLNNVSFEIAPGTTVAVVGSTGAGKSTLTDLIARMQDPTEGEIRYDGHRAPSLTGSARTSAIAYVPQSAFIFEDTIIENLTLGQMNTATGDAFSEEEMWHALKLAHADSFVADLDDGLQAVIGERGATLSGGQRQRLAIARALLRNPRLLILDDATSAVDPLVEQAILTGIRQGAAGVSVLLVAYRRASIALADRIVHLEGGAVVDIGSHEELIGRDSGYAHLVNTYHREREESR